LNRRFSFGVNPLADKYSPGQYGINDFFAGQSMTTLIEQVCYRVDDVPANVGKVLYLSRVWLRTASFDNGLKFGGHGLASSNKLPRLIHLFAQGL
jgi:hypothetical protein